MRSNTLIAVLLILAPLGAFLVALNRPVPLAPLEGTDARCDVCDRKATRTLKAAAEALRTKGVYVYRRSEYPSGMPAWCDLHGPEKMKENAVSAYLAAITAFAMISLAYITVRNRRQ